MFSYKNKNHRQSPIAQHPLSPRPPLAQQKKQKIHAIHQQGAQNKPKHKPTSKSQLQNYQEKHHNSPIWPKLQAEIKSTSPFSFTTILHKHIKEQSFPLTNHFSTNNHTQKYDPENSNNANFSKKQNLCNSYFTPNILSTSVDKKVALQEMCFSLNTLQHKHDFSYQKSTGRQSKKSPIRLVNANKLNNTPKIKERKEPKQTIPQNKTFKAVLDSNINKSSRQNSKQNINLECSQKIQNCILNNDIKHQTNHNKHSASKSNLQSTGFINMSQPLDCNEALMPQTTTKISKNAPLYKSIAKKTISQSVNQFHEEEQQSNEQAQRTKLRELKSKIVYLQHEYQNRITDLGPQQFLQQIHEHYNPELNSNILQQQINQLKCLKQQTVSDTRYLLETFSSLSFKIINKINESIQILEDSYNCCINWTQIQSQLAKKDHFQLSICKNQLILQNIDLKSKVLDQQPQDKQNISDPNSLQQFLSSIQASIQEQTAFLQSQKSTAGINTSLSQTTFSQFQAISTKLNQLKRKLIESTSKF